MYNYVRDGQTGIWNLSKPIPIPPGTDSLSLNEIVHVAWNSMGNALSVVDSCGRILIYNTGSVQGDLSLVRQNLMDQDDSMHALVGLHWLPVHPQEEKVSLVELLRLRKWLTRYRLHFIGQQHKPEMIGLTVVIIPSPKDLITRCLTNRA